MITLSTANLSAGTSLLIMIGEALIAPENFAG